MKRCKICVLPETFPGIKFNDHGICNFCVKFKGNKSLNKKKQKYKNKFEELITKYKGENNYDALMSYSGGKDSTYTLSLMKEKFGLNILSLTLDNGFLSEQTFENIQVVIERLGIDHIFFKPRFDVLKKIFLRCAKENIFPQQTLRRASSICTACMAIVKFSSLRFAVEKKIPFVIYGWSPGQIPISSSVMKNNPQFLQKTQQNLYGPLLKLVGKDMTPYFLEEKHFRESRSFPYNISPLAFLDYNEKQILGKIAQLGWKTPEDVDIHSTNCLLNSFANRVHVAKYGHHPYVFDLAKLVREGYLTRSDGLERLDRTDNIRALARVKNKLGLN